MKAENESLFKTYFDIQRTHFDREENCFFIMSTDLIPVKQWNQIYFNMCSYYTEICDSI